DPVAGTSLRRMRHVVLNVIALLLGSTLFGCALYALLSNPRANLEPGPLLYLLVPFGLTGLWSIFRAWAGLLMASGGISTVPLTCARIAMSLLLASGALSVAWGLFSLTKPSWYPKPFSSAVAQCAIGVTWVAVAATALRTLRHARTSKCQ